MPSPPDGPDEPCSEVKSMESRAVHYPFLPAPEPPEPIPNTKQCSVRGCPHPVPDDSTNRMCDTCRSRHRVYATTKRARRKLEKAAVANGVSAPIGVDSMAVDFSQMDSISTAIAPSWATENPEPFEEESSISTQQEPRASTTISHPTPTAPFTHWNPFDPRLFPSNLASSSTQHVHLPQSNSSSELANALTLPPPRQEIPYQAVPPPQTEVKEQGQPGQTIEEHQSPVAAEPMSSEPNSVSTRICSVKGCKTVIPGSYKYKMCSPCRTRYRTYGITKRAKWKSEKEALNQDMAELRVLEDKRRALTGLPPLADNPEELRAWELSVLDEEVPSAEETSPQSMGSSIHASPEPISQAPMKSMLSLNYISPNNTIPSVYPTLPGSITNTPYSVSVSPYAHIINNKPSLPPMAIDEPLPTRMCTVSHCNTILPKHYRFKRCEQHRLQNQRHTRLKRSREKVVKALEQEDGAPESESDFLGDDDADGSVSADTSGTSKGKGKQKETNVLGFGANDNPTGSSSSRNPAPIQLGPTASTAPQGKPKASGSKSKEEAQKRRHSCSNEGCHNLLTPGVRWRTCDECRNRDRLSKARARAMLRASENDKKKNLTQPHSDVNPNPYIIFNANRTEESTTSNNSVSMMSTDSRTVTNVIPEVAAPLDETDEEDADGEPDIESPVEDPQSSQPQPQPQTQAQAQALPIAQSATQPEPKPESNPQPTAVTIVNLNPNKKRSTWQTPWVDEVSVRPPTPPPPHHLRRHHQQRSKDQTSPNYNSLTKQVNAKAESSQNVNLKGAFSRFRVELPSSVQSVPIYSGFLPKTGSSLVQENSGPSVSAGGVGGETVPGVLPKAIEDIQSVKVNSDSQSDVQIVQNTRTDPLVPTNPTQESTTPPISVPIANTNLGRQSVPPPTQKKVLAKGKKAKKASASSATTDTLSAPSAPTTFPYILPTSNPYYPYVMSPFPHPETNKNHTGVTIQTGYLSSSTLSAPMPVEVSLPFLQYPQLPPPHLRDLSYLFLPPRYTPNNNNTTSSPAPIPPPAVPSPGVNQGQPLSTFAPPSASSSSKTSGTAGSSTSTVQEGSRPSTSARSKQDQPSTVAAAEPVFTHYHQFDSKLVDPNRPVKKRRKADPNYRETYKAIHGVYPSTNNTASASSSSVSISVPEKSVDVPLLGASGLTVNSADQPTENSQPCARKGCERTIPPSLAGTICDKCRLKFKKHQAKIKQRHKLEPHDPFMRKA